MSNSDSSDDEFFDCLAEPIKYYAVTYAKDKGNGFVTPDLKEAREKAKSVKGSRFTCFNDPLQARKYAQTSFLEDDEKKIIKKNDKKGIELFPSISFKEFNNLKTHIEKGNVEKVEEIIFSNPKYIITETDNPALLQIRFRYNAIHIAATSNQPEIIRVILDYICSDDLWSKIYPETNEAFKLSAKNRLMDLYLNSPDVGNNETPLHFASKFGNYNCIRELLRYKITDQTMKNKSGQFAQDIICQRYNGEDKIERSEKIVVLFSEKYIALLEGDNKVSESLTYGELTELISKKLVRAYMGPISTRDKCELIRKRWLCQTRQDKLQYRSLRCSDELKGLEAHGRELAHEYDTGWFERWHFLDDDLVDLNSDAGLSRLENYLDSVAVSDDSRSIVDSSTSSRSLSRLYNSLSRLFSKMTLQSPPQEMLPPTKATVPSQCTAVTQKFNLSINRSRCVTPDDKRVYQAIQQTALRRSHSTLNTSIAYPRIQQFVSELDELLLHTPPSSPVQLNTTSKLNSFATSTPVHKQPSLKQHNPQLSPQISPIKIKGASPPLSSTSQTYRLFNNCITPQSQSQTSISNIKH